jgi:hypothetical protein
MALPRSPVAASTGMFMLRMANNKINVTIDLFVVMVITPLFF